MRQFAYIGDKEEVALYGATFPRGVPTPVADEFLLKKLEGNNHFQEHKGRRKAEKPEEKPEE